jgi:hypothetical protein
LKKIQKMHFANLGILFLDANLGILPILKAVKRPEEHVMERPALLWTLIFMEFFGTNVHNIVLVG